MAENAQQPPQPQVSILSQFTRDLSFENIAAIKQQAPQGKPDIQVAVNLDARARGEDRYEVSLKITANAKSGEESLFMVELDYAGVFHVVNVPQEQLHPFLLIECPRQLFPFARRIIADVTRDGGYPPLMLDMVDFVAIYRQELQRRQAEQAAAEGSGQA
ncbi:preprotein translocase subunit SecB [Oceanicella actignis]|uniref:Protein-export protein SecB n=2 Tax=Oceanicella actignis TaxID=1189325 RepID=A0A1M7T271_9RHOB|nr:protein-export chaperone SecB [Oceanicella actignis]TYO88884.1 preprotein translocase subunit SecB [Oceanicella actignis]SET38567.1 protein translocase subunit secB [Oceanicella actignis]SHN64767.1 preprotein translocase subunit SecB [Oceanicella actignis]